MELVVFKVCAEEGGLCARVREGYADITDDRGLVLLDAQLSGSLLENNLEEDRKVNMICTITSFSV